MSEVIIPLSDPEIKQLTQERDSMKYTETTQDYNRLSGQDIARKNVEDAVAEIVRLMLSVDPEDVRVADFDYFEDSFVGLYIKKLHLMVAKQKDYGPENITKAGERGLVTRMQDKVERLKKLLGNPDEQVKQVRELLEKGYEAEEMYEFIAILDSIEQVVTPQQAANESVEDTWIDAGNYGDIGYQVHENAWPRPLRG